MSVFTMQRPRGEGETGHKAHDWDKVGRQSALKSPHILIKMLLLVYHEAYLYPTEVGVQLVPACMFA
jgi:hypothetical protein